MPDNLPDGTLLDWSDVEASADWQTLLLGNGLSIHVWSPFAYRELYEHAKEGGLTDEDKALFGQTPNFERVLGDLLTAIRINDELGIDTGPAFDRYRSIQLALGHAIREVHLNRDMVPTSTRLAIREVLAAQEWVFTTSYDLLLYWAIAATGNFDPFKDGFRWGGRCEFDPSRADVFEGEVPIYFLHGALHLVVGGSGVTWKLRRQAIRTLLDQFGQPIPGDDEARPLLVTEGSARDKMQAIEANAYLSHAYEQLQENDLPVVVFGSSLSAEDRHLADALNEHPDRPIAVSMLPGDQSKVLTRQMDIYGRLWTDELYFFDATTHPLGDDALCVEAR